jgi:hypothetical protein
MKFPARMLLVGCGLLMLAACATMAPPQPPSLELPKPPLDLRAIRKGGKTILTWTVPSVTTDRQTVRSLGPTRICRGAEPVLSRCGTPVGQARAGDTKSDKKSGATYTDTIPSDLQQSNANGYVTYAVEVNNAGGRSAGLSNQVRVPLIRTLPPPQDFVAQVTNQGVALSWTNDAAASASRGSARYIYRVYRHLISDPHEILIGEIPAAGEGRLTLTDSNIEWEKAYQYRLETVTVMAQEGKPELQVEGDDSPELKVFADDKFPPAVPSGLQAVYSGAGGQSFVDLIWAPVPDLDLAGYNIYRHEAGTDAVKLNTELVKTPAFRDANVAAGKNYLYSVSAVDARGNESARSEEAGESVP